MTATAAAAAAATTTAAGTSTTSSKSFGSLASLQLQYFKAVSLYRRRNYEKCIEVCNSMLQAGHENNVQMFATPPDQIDNNNHDDDDDDVDGGDGVSNGDKDNSDNYNNAQQHQKLPQHQHQQQTFSKGNSSSSSSSTNNNNNNNNNMSRYSSNLQWIGPRPQGRRRFAAANATDGNNSNNNNNFVSNNRVAIMPTWLMEGVWQLKMRALTQRVYVDDLETNDADDSVKEEVEFERIATTARPGTSIKTAFVPRPSTSNKRLRTAATASTGRLATTRSIDGRQLTSSSTRPISGMARPGTSLSRPGSSLGGRPASRCATASRVRATSAAAFRLSDSTAKLYQASRLNPTIYAEREVLVKALFQFLFYHEADVQKSYSLCEAVIEVQKQKQHKALRSSQVSLPRSGGEVDWWWYQQLGRCLLALHYPRKAEPYLEQSLAAFPHPDTYLLLSRLYQRLEQPERALELINTAVDRHPFDVVYRTEQGRIYDAISKPDDAMQIYRLISKLNPINVEALACIAVNYFYDNNPEMALMYYRRILSLGVHTAELYCNIALCCLYGGQIELVLPCFQRALIMATATEQKADIWYNLSFVAITTGDFHLARRCLKLCLTSDARNGAALNNIAVLAAHAGDIMNAKSYLNAAKEVLRDSIEISENLKYMDAHYKL